MIIALDFITQNGAELIYESCLSIISLIQNAKLLTITVLYTQINISILIQHLFRIVLLDNTLFPLKHRRLFLQTY
jgi:hypothetical protein